MKAILKLDNKVIENEKIGNVSLLIMLGEEFKEKDFYYNEEYVLNNINSNCKTFKITEYEIECPCNDLVYLSNSYMTGEGEDGYYPANEEELKMLIGSYNKIAKVFGKERVKIAVYSCYLYENYNEDDFSLEEFLMNFRLEK